MSGRLFCWLIKAMEGSFAARMDLQGQLRNLYKAFIKYALLC
jgi:hypothetical protein